MKKQLIKNKGIHTEADSLVEVKIGDKVWYNLCRDFDVKKKEFKGKTDTFTDINKAIKMWGDEH